MLTNGRFFEGSILLGNLNLTGALKNHLFLKVTGKKDFNGQSNIRIGQSNNGKMFYGVMSHHFVCASVDGRVFGGYIMNVTIN